MNFVDVVNERVGYRYLEYVSCWVLSPIFVKYSVCISTNVLRFLQMSKILELKYLGIIMHLRCHRMVRKCAEGVVMVNFFTELHTSPTASYVAVMGPFEAKRTMLTE